MDTPKKVLIFYASAGHGHENAARAVMDAVRERHPDWTVKTVDVVKLMNPFAGEVYRQTYLIQIKHLPAAWGMFYYSFDVPWFYRLVMRHIRRAYNELHSGGLKKLLAEEKPDVIFTTHFFTTETVGLMRKKGKIGAKLVTVVTDYYPHYVWVADGVDRYAVALPLTAEGLVERGADKDAIRVTGIPVEKKFFKPVSRSEVLASLKLKDGPFTALVTSGGVGLGDAGSLVKKILKDAPAVQVILVCGSNKALYETMSRPEHADPRLAVLGFVKNMNELMEVSDLVVGKAGGLTVTESFLKGKPVVLIGSIPGQEARNVICVKKIGAGVEAKSADEAAAAVARLSGSPEEMARLKKGVAEIARPRAAQDIAELADR